MRHLSILALLLAVSTAVADGGLDVVSDPVAAGTFADVLVSVDCDVWIAGVRPDESEELLSIEPLLAGQAQLWIPVEAVTSEFARLRFEFFVAGEVVSATTLFADISEDEYTRDPPKWK